MHILNVQIFRFLLLSNNHTENFITITRKCWCRKINIISYAEFLFIIDVEAAVDPAQCTTTCPDSSKCGGPRGLISVYDTFKAFSTLDLFIKVTDLNNDTIEAKSKTNSAQDALTLADASNPISTGEVCFILLQFVKIKYC